MSKLWRDRVKTCVVALVVGIGACATATPPSEFDVYGPFLDSLMAEMAVPGLGFAVFNDQGLPYEHVAGLKD